MPNPIIQNFLDDNSIDSAKRLKIFNALGDGSLPESQALNSIMRVHGGKYVQQIYTQGQAGKTSLAPRPTPAQPAQKPQDNSILGGIFGGGLLEGQNKSTPVGNFIQNKALPIAGQAVTEAIEKPILGKEGTGMVNAIAGKQNVEDFGVGAIKSVPSTLTGLAQISPGEEIKKTVLGDEKYSQLDTTKALEAARQATEPTNAAQGFGKAVGDVAQFAVPAPLEIKAANDLKGVIEASKAAPWIKSLLKIGATGAPSAATTALVTAAQEGEYNDTVARNAVIAGVLPGVFEAAGKAHSYVSKLLTTPEKLEAKAAQEAADAGLQPYVFEQIKNMTPEQKIVQKKYMDLAFENLKKPDTVASPMEDLADEVTGGMRQLFQRQKEAGAGIGKIKGDVITGQAVPKSLPVANYRKDLLGSLAEKGVTVTNTGKLSFKGSTMADLKGDQQALNILWDAIKKKPSLSEKEALILRERLQNVLYSGKAKGEMSVAESFVKNFERSLTKDVHGSNTELAELDDVFSELVKATQSFSKKTKGSTPLTAEGAMDGTNTFNLLRRSLGSGNKEAKTLVQKLQTLGEKYGIKELQGIMDKRRFAQTAEDIAGTDVLVRNTSFAGRAANAGQSMLKTAQNKLSPKNWAETAGAVKELIKKSPGQKETLLKLMNEPLNAETLQKIAQTEVGQAVKAHLEMVLPKVSTAVFMETLKSIIDKS